MYVSYVSSARQRRKDEKLGKAWGWQRIEMHDTVKRIPPSTFKAAIISLCPVCPLIKIADISEIGPVSNQDTKIIMVWRGRYS